MYDLIVSGIKTSFHIDRVAILCINFFALLSGVFSLVLMNVHVINKRPVKLHVSE